MKAYTAIIAKEGKQKSLEINAPNQEAVRQFVRDKYPGWKTIRITEHR